MQLFDLIKKNIAVSVAIGAPLVIIALFAAFLAVPRAVTPPPRFAVVLVATRYVPDAATKPVTYAVVDGEVIQRRHRAGIVDIFMGEELVLYTPDRGARIVDYASVRDAKIAAVAPDGYLYAPPKVDSIGGLVFGLFTDSANLRPTISKNGAIYHIELPAGLTNARLLGWVIAEGV
jgi:hypothetical protein